MIAETIWIVYSVRGVLYLYNVGDIEAYLPRHLINNWPHLIYFYGPIDLLSR